MSATTSAQPRGKGVLFGYPIAHSMAPLLHNTVFNNLDIPWDFGFMESKDIQEFLPLMKSDECYGEFLGSQRIFHILTTYRLGCHNAA